jgi:site-specific recombinase XerD
MIAAEKRGRKYFAYFYHKSCRLRGSLGTRSRDVALRLIHMIETALAEGHESSLWQELQTLLPQRTYKSFADHAGVKPKQLPTWDDLKTCFSTFREQRVRLGNLAQSTSYRYEVTIREFGKFLATEKITMLHDISKPVVERFKVWRVERINKKKHSRGATGLVLDAAILHRLFSFAVESEMVLKNPVRMEGRPGENPKNGAEPFTAAQLSKMREQAGRDLLMFLLLRWTGLRGVDVVKLTWSEVHLDQKEIERVTQKRKKRVILPMHSELLFALDAECARLKPEQSAQVLLNPTTGTQMTRPRLYQKMLALGKRAGVAGAHPHRFRDTLAVDMLSRGASPYDVAKMLGDTIETVERHYTPFVKELRDRVRGILETSPGIEEAAKIPLRAGQNALRKAN